MGIIAGKGPGTKKTQSSSIITASTEEIKALAKKDIKYYKPLTDLMSELTYAELQNLKALDSTLRVDLLALTAWPLKYPTPIRSGFTQMVQRGNYPGI